MGGRLLRLGDIDPLQRNKNPRTAFAAPGLSGLLRSDCLSAPLS
jgi:hypothetical protein